MSMGLGHRYWVHMITFFEGTLEECIEHMKNNKPKNKYQWYELRPLVNVKEKSCDKYTCDLVEMSK